MGEFGSMPDIREVLNALDEQDKRLWSQHRTEMRRSYMAAHNAVLGIAAWDHNDDAFIDLIDIKLALLFDKAGRFTPKWDGDKIKEIIASEDGNKIIEQIENDATGLKLVDKAAGWTSK